MVPDVQILPVHLHGKKKTLLVPCISMFSAHPHPNSYLQFFPKLKKAFGKYFKRNLETENDAPVDPKSAGALWALMIAKLYIADPNCPDKKIVYCDNYYGRHSLARFVLILVISFGDSLLTVGWLFLFASRAVEELTDGMVGITSTIKFGNVEAVNKPGVLSLIHALKDAPQGSWGIVPAYEVVHNECLKTSIEETKRLKKKYKAMVYKNNSIRFRRTGFSENDLVDITMGTGKSSQTVKAVKTLGCGYLGFKDSKTVLFYTSDFDKSFEVNDYFHVDTTKPLPDAVEAVVRFLAKIHRWTDASFGARSMFEVAAPIVGYNKYMNGVDRLDHNRSNNMLSRRACRLSISLFGFVIDMAIYNGFAVYKHLRTLGENSKVMETMVFPEFKRKVCIQLIKNEYNGRAELEEQRKEKRLREEQALLSSGKKARLSTDHDELRCHQIAPTIKSGGKTSRHKRLSCHLCHLAYVYRRNKSLTERNDRVSWACVQCKVGFHVTCFNVWHHTESLKEKNAMLHDFVQEMKEAQGSSKAQRCRGNNSIGDAFASMAEAFMRADEDEDGSPARTTMIETTNETNESNGY